MTNAQAWKLTTPHDSSICCMHSDRLPLIHLKTFVVLYVYTVYQVNFGNLWCLTLYRTRISECTAAHSKIFFDFILTWEHFMLWFNLSFCILIYIYIYIYWPVCVKCHGRGADIRLVWWLSLTQVRFMLACDLTADIYRLGLCVFRPRSLCSHFYIPYVAGLPVDLYTSFFIVRHICIP